MRTWRLIPLLLLSAAAGPTFGPREGVRVAARVCQLVARHWWDRRRLPSDWPARCEDAGNAATQADLYANLNALLAQLGDSHLFAVDPVRVRIERRAAHGRPQASYGLAMAPDADDRWRVTQVAPASAAAHAGIAAGWQILSINGHPVDIDDDPAPGVSATFRFRRPNGQLATVPLVATLAPPLPTRRSRALGGGVWLAALDGFDPGDERWLAALLAAERPSGLLLDLRGNDGGDAAVIARVAGLLFAQDRPLVERLDAHRRMQQTSGAGPHSYLGPLAVLIGSESASGAEALAALVAESGRGTTVGARTAGALTGAAVYPLPDGGDLSVAEYDLRTPGGQRLEGRGLEPQVQVVATSADLAVGRDPVLTRAVALVRARRLH